MIIRRSRRTGANTALRTPTTMRVSPLYSRCQASNRSPSDRLLCRTSTYSPSTARNRPINCGVKEISGTSIIAPSPRSSTARRVRRYTSVFPLPVTPCSRISSGSPVSSLAKITSSAACCSPFNTSSCPLRNTAQSLLNRCSSTCFWQINFFFKSSLTSCR